MNNCDWQLAQDAVFSIPFDGMQGRPVMLLGVFLIAVTLRLNFE
jgi:hypothetical protein